MPDAGSLHGTRLIVDLFGPLVDVGKIDAFEGTNARFRTEEAISERLNARFPHQNWSADDVSKTTLNHLVDQKLALPLLDGEMLRLLCEAAKSSAKITIVSSVPSSDLFDAARTAVLKYNDYFHRSREITTENFIHLPRSELLEPHGVERFLRENLDDAIYTIVVDDGPPFSLTNEPDLERGTHYDAWFPGDNQTQALEVALDAILMDRRRKGEAEIFISAHAGGLLKLNDYCAVPGFVVFDEFAREKIRSQVQTIQNLIENERETGLPICVLLGGPPGSGKSYFVKRCASEGVLGAAEDYPVTSLSGVSDGKFDQAVERHIEEVFDRRTKESVAVAFLDEVDTTPSEHHGAFRLLMDAMTGRRTDELGLGMERRKSGNISGLVWFFAASAGGNRQAIIRELSGREWKLTDFLDRIQFDIELPGADRAGQAIVQGLASIHKYDEVRVSGAAEGTPKKIEKVACDVLLVLGLTSWSSVRQLDTICRLVIGHYDRKDGKLEIDDFEGVDTWGVLRNAFDEIDARAPFSGKYVKIDWGNTRDA